MTSEAFTLGAKFKGHQYTSDTEIKYILVQYFTVKINMMNKTLNF